MIQQLHGKYYYIEVDSIFQGVMLQQYIATLNTYKDEKFTIVCYGGQWCVQSNKKCATRLYGRPYINWEKCKAYVQALKKDGV